MADKQPPRTKKYYRSTKSGAGMTRAGIKKYRRDNPGSKLKSAVSLLIIILFFSGCQTVKDKTDAIVEKENEKLSKFLGKSASELQMELGKPDEDFKNAKGNFEFVYNSKKYLVPCERRFEINSENIVVGFVSNGCF